MITARKTQACLIDPSRNRPTPERKVGRGATHSWRSGIFFCTRVSPPRGVIMRQYLIVGIFLLLSFPATAADNGIISNPSGSSVPETLDRLEKVIKAKGLTVFARIDHSAEAERVGLKLPPMQLLIFGNPKT